MTAPWIGHQFFRSTGCVSGGALGILEVGGNRVAQRSTKGSLFLVLSLVNYRKQRDAKVKSRKRTPNGSATCLYRIDNKWERSDWTIQNELDVVKGLFSER